MKVNKKKFLISILTISTIAIGSSAIVGFTNISQTKDSTNNVTSDSINTYTSMPMPGPTMDDPRIPSSGGGNNGSVVTKDYEIDWSTKKSPTGNVFFDGDFAYTNGNRTTLLGVDPNTSKTSINLPSSVKEIKGYTKVTNLKTKKQFVGAFEGITSITNVSIGGTNVKIDASAFKGCTKLQNVMMQNNAIRSIGESAFEDCINLKTISLSFSLTVIETNAFKNTYSLEKINLPSNLRTIKDFAFEGSGLKSIDMSKTKVSSIGNNAFKNTKNLTEVKFSNSLNNIGISCFEDSAIKSVMLTPSTLPNIGTAAFKDCRNLSIFKSTARTSKLKEIPKSIFENCVNLSKVEFSQSNRNISFKKIGDNAFKGTKISTWNIGSVGTIGASAFEDCKDLTSLTGQNVLQTVGDSAFKNSGLQVISSVNSLQVKDGTTELSNILTIGSSAFYGTKITTFKSGANLTTIGNGSFKSIVTLEKVDFSLSSRLAKNTNAFDAKDLGKVTWPSSRVFRGNRITH